MYVHVYLIICVNTNLCSTSSGLGDSNYSNLYNTSKIWTHRLL